MRSGLGSFFSEVAYVVENFLYECDSEKIVMRPRKILDFIMHFSASCDFYQGKVICSGRGFQCFVHLGSFTRDGRGTVRKHATIIISIWLTKKVQDSI